MDNNRAWLEDTSFRKAVKKAVGKRFKGGDLFESDYDFIFLDITLEVSDKVQIDDDKEIIEEAISDALDDLNQGDDYKVFCLDSEIMGKDLIVYKVLIRVGSAVYDDWPHGQELYDHIENFLIDEDVIKVSVKSLAK